MKKIIGIISVILLIVGFCFVYSCSKKKISLGVGDMNVSEYIEVNLSDIDKMKNNKENFIVLVYSKRCGGCTYFKDVLNNVIKEKHLIVYGIEASKLTNDHELNFSSWVPRLAVYSEGKIKVKVDANRKIKYFEDEKGLISFFNKYTNMPTMFYINKEQLKNKIDNNESFVISYINSNNNHMFNNYLKDYLYKNYKSGVMYVIDTNVEGIRLVDGEDDSLEARNKWQSFMKEFNVKDYDNVIQYYSNGKVEAEVNYLSDKLYNQKMDEFFNNYVK